MSYDGDEGTVEDRERLVDSLVERGYVTKGQQDRRTNFYHVSEKGLDAIRERRRWENAHVDVSAG